MNKFKFIAEEKIEKKVIRITVPILKCRDCPEFRYGSRGDYCEFNNWVISDADQKYACNIETKTIQYEQV